jgi:hypothetical protein
MTDDRRLILLAEAASAIIQCCDILGQERTNQMLAQINQAQNDLKGLA